MTTAADDHGTPSPAVLHVIPHQLSTVAQLATVLDHLDDAVVLTDLDGRVVTWNRAAEMMSGYTRQDMLGQSVRRVTPAADHERVATVVKRLAAGEAVLDFSARGLRKDGTVFETNVTSIPLRDDDGEIAGYAAITRDVSDAVRMEAQLTAREARYRSLVRHAAEAAFILDAAGQVTFVSDAAERVFGLTRDRLPVSSGWDHVHPDDLPMVAERLAASIAQPGEHLTFEFRSATIRTGEPRWMEVTLTNLLDDEHVEGIVANIRDVTARKETELALAASEARFRGHFDHAAVGQAMTTIEGARFVEVNQAYCEMTGYSQEELRTMCYLDVAQPEAESRQQNRHLFERLLAGEIASYHVEERYLHKSGEHRFVANSVALVRDSHGAPRFITSTVQDISERKRMERELEHLALHDSLTGLPNRSLLHDRLERALARAERTDGLVTVVFVDVDQFKSVNDSRGHGAGDELLCAIATRLSDVMRDADTIARFGGDEFVIVCDGIADQPSAVAVGQRIVAAFDEPIVLDSGAVFATVSGGVAISSPTSTADELLLWADAAMYRAKERGRARIEVYDHGSPTRAEARLSLVAGLHRALDVGELVVAYQPVVDMADGSIVSAEALVRWDHPDRGRIGPLDFIPVAEETGLITRVGAAVLRDACRHLARWRRVDPLMVVSVNLSGRQLADRDVVELVGRTLAEFDLPASALCLEVTETVAMDGEESYVAVLEQLHDLGVRLAIDDFGTGYSSLRNLRRLPVDAVKIDREFVDGLPVDPHDHAIVSAMFAMASALGLVVIAEGVETDAQHAALRRLGCNFAQGFRYARPLEPSRFEHVLTTRARLPLAGVLARPPARP
ncbi:MAG TPA: EAL domain-containing protein [Acidimicrobiales bacterium]|nr:EAL domain-containing protein [Acidimicrobiales bacterium]